MPPHSSHMGGERSRASLHFRGQPADWLLVNYRPPTRSADCPHYIYQLISCPRLPVCEIIIKCVKGGLWIFQCCHTHYKSLPVLCPHSLLSPLPPPAPLAVRSAARYAAAPPLSPLSTPKKDQPEPAVVPPPPPPAGLAWLERGGCMRTGILKCLNCWTGKCLKFWDRKKL